MRIVLTGKMGSGKSHIAGLLVPLGYERLHFATPLKQAALCFQDKPSRELLQKLSEVSLCATAPDAIVRLFLLSPVIDLMREHERERDRVSEVDWREGMPAGLWG